VQAISHVEVEKGKGVTRVILRGARDPIYTAFMLSDPPRLLLDLPDVVFDGVETPIRVDGEVVGEITLGAFGDPRVSPSMARVSIGLRSESDYEVIPNGDQVIVEIRPRRGAAPTVADTGESTRAARGEREETEPAWEEPAEEPAPKQTVAKIDPETPKRETAAQPQSKPEAKTKPKQEATRGRAQKQSRIVKVVPGDNWIDVQAEGPVDNLDSFLLHNPERLVVDFWGTKNASPRSSITMDGSVVRKIRIGQHRDRVRLVLDLAQEVKDHTIQPTPQGVRIRVAEPSATASRSKQPAPAPAAPSPSQAPAKAKAKAKAAKPTLTDKDRMEGPRPTEDGVAQQRSAAALRAGKMARVSSVHFESFSEVDRVVVSLDRSVEPVVVEPDPATIVVDLPGARIAPEVERRVSTREFGGPVQIVSAFQTPDVKYDQVRIVLKRSRTLSPRLTWDGSQLRIEMARGGAAHPASRPGSPTQRIQPSGATSAVLGSASPASASQSTPVTVGSLSMPSTGQGTIGDEENYFAGPSDPGSIDVLREGGFTEEKTYQGRRISLDFKDADVENILRLIADVSDLNIIAGDEVEGEVTIRLVDVPWDQALDVILLTKGLGFVRVGKVLRIAPLDTLKQEEEARLQERRAKEKLEDLVVKLQPVSYADVKEVQQLVSKLLSERGTANIDERTNTLILKDIPSVINEATALVKAIDTQTPQVLIEAKIVEASLTFSRSLGAVFGLGYNALGATGTAWRGGAPDLRLAPTGTGTTAPDAVPGISGFSTQRNNFVVGNPISLATGILTMGLLGLNDHIQLDLQLQAAEANNKGKVISAPRVVTLDNREAKIQQGTAIRFDASDGDSVNTTFIDAVLELTVTPHITADRSIIMKIKVAKNSPATSESSGDVVGINKNETNTEALVFDGQTVVLGGIYVVDKGNQSSKVPFLADVPLLGTAFRNSIRTDTRRELLIFVTPRIVQGLKQPAS
jgi:type IV pilus assembly protein PilQ